jgi:Family of unknown function (DUF6491)
MKRLTASSLVVLMTVPALASAPAFAEPVRKTELVELDGTSVDRIQLRHDMDAGWVVDNQNILYRDTYSDHYLVTLKEPCRQLDSRSRSFKFFPSWSWRLLASNTYEVRPRAGLPCSVARIERVDDTRANTLRDVAQRRIW